MSDGRNVKDEQTRSVASREMDEDRCIRSGPFGLHDRKEVAGAGTKMVSHVVL